MSGMRPRAVRITFCLCTNMSVSLRDENPDDVTEIGRVTTAAFEQAEHSDGTEADIVERLRSSGNLTVSMVAVAEGGAVVGHIAFSPVTITDGSTDWYGLGPVSVLPERQGTGIGSRLIRRGIEVLKERNAAGIVLLGNPDYYGRFGFESDPQVRYPGPPPEYFQRLVLRGDSPCGEVSYCSAFGG